MKIYAIFVLLQHIDHGKAQFHRSFVEYTKPLQTKIYRIVLDNMDLSENGELRSKVTIQMEYIYRGEKYILIL